MNLSKLDYFILRYRCLFKWLKLKYVKRKRKFLYKIILLILVINLIFYLFNRNNHIDQRKPIYCLNNKIDEVKYIFDLSRWSQLLLNLDKNLNVNLTKWCDVPSQLRFLANSICRVFKGKDCSRLPCQMIYSSRENLEDIQSFDDGQLIHPKNHRFRENQSEIFCKVGYSLDLFLKSSYPSLISDPYIRIDKSFYKMLNDKYRHCDSIWTFLFNFESITNYPWNSDQQIVQFFDVTFGYDRQRYDFIPHPWLFNYIEQIVSIDKRLSIEQVIQNKKRIYSKTNSTISWTNTQKMSLPMNETSDMFYVKSPIMWMNTNCQTPSKRTEYVNELSNYISIDNYGNCGKSRLNLPSHIIQIQKSENKNLKDRGSYFWEEGKLSLTKDYLFTIAIENSFNYDYITEKLWHPLIVGSIPIYLGAPNVEDWLPCQTDCIINLKQFKTPKQAALFIQSVAQNETLYRSYHLWRSQPLKKEFYSIRKYFQNLNNYTFHSILCSLSHYAQKQKDLQQLKQLIKRNIGTF